jgi:hypothetical protein
MKKFFAAILSALMFCLVMPFAGVTVSAYNPPAVLVFIGTADSDGVLDAGDVSLALTSQGLTISDRYCVTSESFINCPGFTSIGSTAFINCTGLTSVVLPTGIISIGTHAFYSCTSLTSVSIPDSVTSIGSSAFKDCDALTSISLPDSIISIGDYAFQNCDLLATVNIPTGVTVINSYTFAYCGGLTSIIIPNGVTNIGNGAFSTCYNLTTITIPASVTTMSESIFTGCDALQNVYTVSGSTAAGYQYYPTGAAASNFSSITYAETYGCVNTSNPGTYYHGTGVANFSALSGRDGYTFAGWSPASISTTALGPVTVTATWTPVGGGEPPVNPTPVTPEPEPVNPAPVNPGYVKVIPSSSGSAVSLPIASYVYSLDVTAILNESGSVNGIKTAAAIKAARRAAPAARSIKLIVPPTGTGLSGSASEKIIAAAGKLKLSLILRDGEITMPLSSPRQILPGLYFDTARIAQIEEYVKQNRNANVLGSFETAQKGGWGAYTTLTIPLSDLGFEADDGEMFYAFIYDTKAKEFYRAAVEIKDGNAVISTEHTGIVIIVRDYMP